MNSTDGCYAAGSLMLGGSFALNSLSERIAQGRSRLSSQSFLACERFRINKMWSRSVQSLALRGHLLGIGLLAAPTIVSFAVKVFSKD